MPPGDVGSSTAAPTVADAARELRRRGWIVFELKPQSPSLSLLSWSPRALLPIRSRDTAISLRQLALMTRTGLSLLRALGTLAEQCRHPRLAGVWLDVQSRIEEGSSLAEALERHACFSDLVIQLVRAGEQSGTLDTVLQRAADALDARRKLRNGVLSALLYPTIVLVITTIVTAYLLLSLVPKLESFLTQLGRRLPPSMQLLVDLSHLLREHLLTGGILAGAALVALLLIRRHPVGLRVTDRALLALPLIGTILRLSGTVLFARALQLLLDGGINLLDALQTCRELIRNGAQSAAIERARDEVLSGSELARPIRDSRAFEPMLSHMIAVGEESGTVDEVLGQVADFHEDELNFLIQWLGTIIEPVIIVIVGSIVGFVYISTFLTVYSAV